MNINGAREIFDKGPEFDVGVDARYYIAKGFLEGFEAGVRETIPKLARYLDHWSNCDSLKNESGLGCSCGLSKVLEEVMK